ARVTVTEKADAVHVSLGSGSAYAWLADGATKVTDGPARAEDGWTSLGSGAGLVISAGKAGDARTATTRCTRDANAAADGARALLAPDASLGTLGARHVVLRREARAACAVAALRVAEIADDAERKTLQGLVDEADRAWHSSHLGEAKAR